MWRRPPRGRARVPSYVGTPVRWTTIENKSRRFRERFDTHNVPAGISAGGFAYVGIGKPFASDARAENPHIRNTGPRCAATARGPSSWRKSSDSMVGLWSSRRTIAFRRRRANARRPPRPPMRALAYRRLRRLRCPVRGWRTGLRKRALAEELDQGRIFSPPEILDRRVAVRNLENRESTGRDSTHLHLAETRIAPRLFRHYMLHI